MSTAHYFRMLRNGTDRIEPQSLEDLYPKMINAIEEEERRQVEARASRFYMQQAAYESSTQDRRRFPPALIQVPFYRVKNDFENAHITGELADDYFWMDDAFALHPVTVGGLARNPDYLEEKSIIYGTGTLVANGLVVGEYNLIDA